MKIMVDVGDKIKVSAKVLPKDKMDIEPEDLPEYFEGEVVSIRKNTKGWFFKFKIYEQWLREEFDNECGYYTSAYMEYRDFTLPMCAISKTAFLFEERKERRK